MTSQMSPYGDHGYEVEVRADGTVVPPSINKVVQRCYYLEQLNEQNKEMRRIIRIIMNGGPDAVKLLVGSNDPGHHIPAANLILSGMDRLAQRSGTMPTVRVEGPTHDDRPSVMKAAERQESFIKTLDKWSKLRMKLPQLIRWMAGYGFAPMVMEIRRHPDLGVLYPHLALRDPFSTYISAFGPEQQPQDMAVKQLIPRGTLREMYPEKMKALESAELHKRRGPNGAFLLGASSSPTFGGPLSDVTEHTWDNPQSDGITVFEYYDPTGMYLVHPDTRTLLDYVPTPQGMGRMFHIFKRFSFDRLQGQFDQAVGPLGMLVKLNVLAYIATKDHVFRETNVMGTPTSGKYKRGRGKINTFTEGTRVERPNDANNFEIWAMGDRMEQQLRQVAGYAVADDGKSPNSFATGQGIRELGQAADNITKELHLVTEDGLTDFADRGRLRIAKEMFGNETYETFDGKTFKPSKHLRRMFHCKRIYGVGAGLDSAARSVEVQQLLSIGILDQTTAMENIDGIEDVQKIKDRQRVDKVIFQLDQAVDFMMQQGAPPNPQALQVLVAQLPAGKMRDLYENLFFPEAEEPLDQGPATVPEGPPQLAQQGDSVTTVLSRLTAQGESQGGVQTVSQV